MRNDDWKNSDCSKVVQKSFFSKIQGDGDWNSVSVPLYIPYEDDCGESTESHTWRVFLSGEEASEILYDEVSLVKTADFCGDLICQEHEDSNTCPQDCTISCYDHSDCGLSNGLYYDFIESFCLNPGTYDSHCQHRATRPISYCYGFRHDQLHIWNYSELFDSCDVIDGHSSNFLKSPEGEGLLNNLKERGIIFAREVNVMNLYENESNIPKNESYYAEQIYNAISEPFEEGFDAVAYDEFTERSHPNLMRPVSIALEKIKKDYPEKMLFVWSTTGKFSSENAERTLEYTDFLVSQIYFSENNFGSMKKNEKIDIEEVYSILDEKIRHYTLFFPDIPDVEKKIIVGLSAGDTESLTYDLRPDRDFKKFLDLQFNRVMNYNKDYSKGIALYSIRRSNFETNSWISRLFEHYIHQQNENLYSDGEFILSFIENSGFEYGISNWTILPGDSGSILVVNHSLLIPDLRSGTTIGSGIESSKIPEGAYVLEMTRGYSGNFIHQEVKELVPGQSYYLEVYSKKYSGDFNTSEIITSVQRFDENPIDHTYEKQTFCQKSFTAIERQQFGIPVYPWYGHTLEMCPIEEHPNRFWTKETIIFIAPFENVKVVITDQDASFGDKHIIDFVQLQEYTLECNFNGVCEPEIGEDYENCPHDCSPQNCELPWGGTIEDGESVTAYLESSVECGLECISETRTCNDGTLSGSYNYESCSVAECSSCVLDGVTVLHDESRTFYSAEVHADCSSIALSRTCNNGVLDGSDDFNKASCRAPDFGSGLVAHYSFENNADDSSGRGHHGTAINVEYVPGIVGNAARFNGVDSFIEIPFDQDFNIENTNELTYSAWIKPESIETGVAIGQSLPYIRHVDGNLHLSMMIQGSQRNVRSENILQPNQWNHIAGTYDSDGYMKIYVNGQLEAKSGPFLNPKGYNSNLYIGKWYWGNRSLFNGTIDEVKIFNYALSGDEIKQLANFVENFGFENEFDEWRIHINPSSSTGTWEIVTENCFEGKCLRLTKGNSTHININQIVGNLIPGETYVLRAMFKTTSDKNARINLYNRDWKNADCVKTGKSSSKILMGSGVWDEIRHKVEIPLIDDCGESTANHNWSVVLYGHEPLESDSPIYYDNVFLSYPKLGLLDTTYGCKDDINSVCIDFGADEEIKNGKASFSLNSLTDKKEEFDTRYREINPRSTLNINFSAFNLLEDGLLNSPMLLEIRYKDVIDSSEGTRSRPFTQRRARIESKIGFVRWSPVTNSISGRDFYSVGYLGDSNNKEWKYAQILFQDSYFPLLRNISDSFSLRIIMPNVVPSDSELHLPIDYIALHKISQEDYEIIYNKRKKSLGFVEAELPPNKCDLNFYDLEFVVYTKDNMEPIYSHTKPCMEEITGFVSGFSSRGDIEPINIGIYSEGGAENISVSISHLEGSFGQKILNSSIEVLQISFSEQRTNRYFFRDYAFLPDMLERFDVINIKPNSSKRIWFKIHVPLESTPGNYSGKIIVKNDRFEQKIDVEFEVLDIILEPTKTFPIYRHPLMGVVIYSTNTSEVFRVYRETGFDPFMFSADNFNRFKLFLDIFIEEGFAKRDIIVSGWLNPCVDLIYFSSSNKYLYHNLSSASFRECIGSNVLEMIDYAADKNISLLFQSLDEPGEDPYKRLVVDRLYDIVREYGGNTTITYASECDVPLDISNSIYILPNEMNQSLPSLTNLVTHKVWHTNYLEYCNSLYSECSFYTTLFSYLRIPVYNRFLKGLYSEKINASIVSVYAFGDWKGDPYNTFYQDWNYRGTFTYPDFLLAYPTYRPDGELIQTMALEGIREGIKDSNYIELLKKMIKKDPSNPISIEANQYLQFLSNKIDPVINNYIVNRREDHGSYEAILEDISDSDEIDFSSFTRIRRQIADYIIALDNSCTLPWGGTIEDGESVTAYQSSSVSCGSSCLNETRTCNDGILNGSYVYEICSVEECPVISCSSDSDCDDGNFLTLNICRNASTFNSYCETLSSPNIAFNKFNITQLNISEESDGIAVSLNNSQVLFVSNSIQLDLQDIYVSTGNLSDGKSFVYVSNLSLPDNSSKSIYIKPNNQNSNAVCFIDMERISDISSCTIVACPSSQGNYYCVKQGDVFVLSGLKNSFAKEHYIEPRPPPGGGGGSLPRTCTERWECDAWSTCINGFSERECVDRNRCGTYSSMPETRMRCSVPFVPDDDVKQSDEEHPSPLPAPEFPNSDYNENRDDDSSQKNEFNYAILIYAIIGFIVAVSIIIATIGLAMHASKKKPVDFNQKNYIIDVNLISQNNFNKLLPYLTRKLQQGFSEEQLLQDLLKVGWKKEQVEYVLKVAKELDNQ